MKTKSLLLALGLLVSGAMLVAQIFAPPTVTVSVEELRYRVSLNHNFADALAPESARGAAYFQGKADALAELIPTNGGTP